MKHSGCPELEPTLPCIPNNNLLNSDVHYAARTLRTLVLLWTAPMLCLIFVFLLAASAPELAAAVQGTVKVAAGQEQARTAYVFGRRALDEEPPDPPASGSMHTHHQHTRDFVYTAATASAASSPDDTGVH